MTPLYQAVMIPDEETYSELAKFQLENTYSRKRFQRQIIIFVLLVAAYYIINGSLLATVLVCGVLFAVTLWPYISIRQPGGMDKKARAAAAEMMQKAEEAKTRLETRYDFNQDAIDWENSCAKGRMNYADIQKIWESSRYYILVTAQRQMLLFWKDRFSSDGSMDFMAFVQARQKEGTPK